jgi:hypothetical protein
MLVGQHEDDIQHGPSPWKSAMKEFGGLTRATTAGQHLKRLAQVDSHSNPVGCPKQICFLGCRSLPEVMTSQRPFQIFGVRLVFSCNRPTRKDLNAHVSKRPRLTLCFTAKTFLVTFKNILQLWLE